MAEKRVVLIKTSPIEQDIRMPKEIVTMKHEGYAVTLLCWDRECKPPHPEQGGKIENPYEEIRLRFRAPLGVKMLLFLPVWWCFEFYHLMVTKWDIAHAINFDSIVPAVIAGKLKRKPVIYEILDTWEDMIALPKIWRYLCIQVDKLFMRLANAVVLADEAQTKGFKGIPNSKVMAVYDSPPDFLRKPIAKENDTFTLFYAGVLYKARRLNLDKVALAVRSIENVRLVIAGYGDLVEEIKEWSRQTPGKIQFIGRISYEETLERSAASDLLFEARDFVIPNHRYICGSKLLGAMMCGRPFLASKDTATADKVLNENCGLVVDANNVEEIREAIIKLRDNPKLCAELGANARKAYEQKYGWHIMEQRLIKLYQELTNKMNEPR